MDGSFDLTRLQRTGNSFSIIIPRQLLAELVWNLHDRIALRRHGNKLVVERVPMEQLAQLHSKPGAQREAGQ